MKTYLVMRSLSDDDCHAPYRAFSSESKAKAYIASAPTTVFPDLGPTITIETHPHLAWTDVDYQVWEIDVDKEETT